MPRVLVVEDTKVFANLLKRRIESDLGFDVTHTASLAETEEVLQRGDETFDVAILDLTLPDSFEGEIVDLVAPRISSLVLTGNIDDGLRDMIWSKGIADYVLKEGAQNIDYALGMVRRLYANAEVTVLVVDDSRVMRTQIQKLLQVHRYRVITANDGAAGLETLSRTPDVRLVITDYNMPRMDGFEFTREIRKIFAKDQLAIIGVSAEGNNLMSARFIKMGANDFLNKPFVSEEFYCRVNHNVEMLDYIRTIKQMATTDHLTGLRNRKYFFELGQALFGRLEWGEISMVVALLDIDHFKRINDIYGHMIGDRVLKRVAGVIRTQFPEPSLVARYGGEEFCILALDVLPGTVVERFECLREAVAAELVPAGKERVSVTVSIGVCTRPGESLEAMLRKADDLLYKAKDAGRNIVRMDA